MDQVLLKTTDSYNNLQYQVNTEGIGNRTVRLRLSALTNTECTYSLKNSYATEEIIPVGFSKNIFYKGLTAITTYDLSQNYPNPFNPSTVINYQVPKSSKVTLKVYDILGNLVSTLVNEIKEPGKYSVNFNASNYASGVYFYELKTDSFVSVKKMAYIK